LYAVEVAANEDEERGRVSRMDEWEWMGMVAYTSMGYSDYVAICDGKGCSRSKSPDMLLSKLD
jgi:hypothetical protein